VSKTKGGQTGHALAAYPASNSETEMSVGVGYLLPTRERIVVGIHETGPILALADHAEKIGLDAVWIGDSLWPSRITNRSP